ncbi:MAG: RlmE family RNA methyltransferase [Bilophila sp.]
MKQYRDHYFLKAKQENYPARSVYKLKEIDARFKIFKPGMSVLDLGAAPGSWSLAASERIGSRGKVVACDIQSTEVVFPPTVSFYQEDVFERSADFEKVLVTEGPFHVVVSDMAPQTTGTRFTDQARSLDLCREALAVAERYLIKGGTFVVKIFMGPDISEFVREMRRRFTRVTSFKPQSSRTESKETFFVALGFKGAVDTSETDNPVAASSVQNS